MGHSNDCPCHACRLDNADSRLNDADSRLDVLETYLGGGAGSQANDSDAPLSGSIVDLIKSESRAQAQAVLKENEVKLTSPALGHIYFQLAGESNPEQLYPGTKWENISHMHKGNFFRAEGGLSSSFGTSQSSALPNLGGDLPFVFRLPFGSLSGIVNWRDCYTSYYHKIPVEYTTSDSPAKYLNLSAVHLGSVYTIGVKEVRPTNESFRIWKRTA